MSSNKCLIITDKIDVVHVFTYRHRVSCSEESCIASVLVKLPHGLCVLIGLRSIIFAQLLKCIEGTECGAVGSLAMSCSDVEMWSS